MTEYSDVRYLLSKRSVDDRALNRGVLEAFRTSLASVPGPPKLLELGAGVGTMVSRLSDWGSLCSGDYTLLDRDHVSLDAAREHLSGWAKAVQKEGDAWCFSGKAGQSRVRLVHAEALEYLNSSEERGAFDGVIANAVLDLMDLTRALRSIWRVLKPKGSFWFSINFDGETIFLPEHEQDARIMQLYHRTMDQRVRDNMPAGDSKTGRRLLTRIGETGATLEAAGSSDWVVFPRNGGYPDDEAYFLKHIVHTIELALATHSELSRASLSSWAEQRHAQIERAELCYIAHQLDVCGTLPETFRIESGA